MNAIAALQVPLTSPRCGLMQSPTLPNVAGGTEVMNVPFALLRRPDAPSTEL